MRALDVSKGDVEITDGITLKKDETAPEPVKVEDVQLPEEGRARESAIDNMLVDRAINFLSSHTLEFKIPKSASEDMKRSLEEGTHSRRQLRNESINSILFSARKKKKAKKLLLPLLLLLKLKAVILLPIILGAIAFIAFKALIIGKIALVLSLIAAVKKLLLGKNDHSSYDIVAHPQVSHSHIGSFADEHHGHGWAARSDPQNLAYSAYAQN